MKRHFFQRGNADGHQAHEKMLNIANYQGNGNLKQNDLSPHIYWNGCNQKEYKQQMLVRIWGKRTLVH